MALVPYWGSYTGGCYCPRKKQVGCPVSLQMIIAYEHSSANARSKGKIDPSMLTMPLDSFSDSNHAQRRISSLSHSSVFQCLWHYSYRHPRKSSVMMVVKWRSSFRNHGVLRCESFSECQCEAKSFYCYRYSGPLISTSIAQVRIPHLLEIYGQNWLDQTLKRIISVFELELWLDLSVWLRIFNN